MRSLPEAYNRYVLGVSLVGTALFLGSAGFLARNLSHSAGSSPELLAFLALIFLTELLPIRIPNTINEVTVTTPFVLGMFLSQGTSATIVVSVIAGMAALIFTQRGVPIRRFLQNAIYNLANHTVSVMLASIVYIYAGGNRFIASANPNLTFRELLYLALWIAVYSFCGIMVLSVSNSLYVRRPWRVCVREDVMKWTIHETAISIPVGVLFVSLYVAHGMLGIVLLVIPFLFTRHALISYARNLSTYQDTITVLGTYIQHHHEYTLGHLQRVADISEKLARQMQLPVSSLMQIRNAGLLHDIGKVGVNEAILDKTEKLSDEEWEIIRLHPVRGAEILAQMHHLERIVPWVRGHHERPDGRGYPDGLVAANIPVEAAVIAVADAFDAMAGEDTRIYRTPMTLDQAIDQVRYGAGTQFDDRVVKAFLSVMFQEDGK